MSHALSRVAPGAALVAGVDRFRWRGFVYAAADLSAVEKAVALVYAEHAGRTTTAVWVDLDRLQRMTGYGLTAVKGAERRLIKARWLIVAESGRSHRRARYALVVPPGPDGEARQPLDAPEDYTSEYGSPGDLNTSEYGSPGDRNGTDFGSRGDDFGSRGDDFGSRGDHVTPPEHNEHTNARADVDDQLASIRSRQADALVVVVRETFPKPSAAMTLRTLAARADALRAAGFTPDTLATALADIDVSTARTPAAALTARLDALAAAGPVRPSVSGSGSGSERTACPVHGTHAGTCSGCASEHKAGDHGADADGPSPACPLCQARQESAA